MKTSVITCLTVLLLAVINISFGQSNSQNSYDLEEGEFLEKTVDGKWIYKTLVSSESFEFQFPADFQPYNSYLKESMAPLIIYNNPQFDKSLYDPYENKWQISDASHMIIQVYDLNEADLDYIFNNYEEKLSGKRINEIQVESFDDDKSVSSEFNMKSYFLSFEDIYYWRVDVIGNNKDEVEKLGETFISDFVEINSN